MRRQVLLILVGTMMADPVLDLMLSEGKIVPPPHIETKSLMLNFRTQVRAVLQYDIAARSSA